MSRKHMVLVFGAVAALAMASASSAQQIPKPLSTLSGTINTGRIRCHGISSVMMTVDPEQTLPLRVAGTLGCNEAVAILADSEGYTMHVRTADGKSGYVARLYVAKDPAAPRPAEEVTPPVMTTVMNGMARWQPGTPGSEQLVSDDLVVESLTVNGVTVQVSLHDTGWKMRASVAIVNSGSESLAIRPSQFRLEEPAPAFRSLAYQDPAEMAKAANHQVLWTSASAKASASAFRAESRSTDGGYAGSYQATAFHPSSPVYVVRQPDLDNTAKQIRASALHTGNLKPGDKTNGAVWFERDSKARELLLRVPVGGVIYEFPLTFNR